ncbi:hypothetical protein RchiOBHm_Chr1g0362101 [Rosa chinensis]|uniref:Uncharacterized protein n=1 Tax=Rosa chinensis TaxID=74649 RepID=A0A2P6SJ59_ROSCH|nr:hypothetical protein RchiOBHm_Chr1g0362101 [Rosa chinensis]
MTREIFVMRLWKGKLVKHIGLESKNNPNLGLEPDDTPHQDLKTTGLKFGNNPDTGLRGNSGPRLDNMQVSAHISAKAQPYAPRHRTD